MQTNKELDLQIVPGAPASAIPRKWFIFVNNVLKYLRVKNGRLDVRNDKWTIICDVNIGWSGRVFFGGQKVFVPNVSFNATTGEANFAGWSGTHVKVNLRTGAVSGVDWDEEDESDLNENEYYSAFSKVETQPDSGIYVYVKNSNTVGDIHCRDT
jgi:hypothetical protein